MQALNIKVKNIPRQTEPVYDPYKNSLNNILNSNIDNILASTINTNTYSLRQTTSTTQPKTPFDVPLSSRLFSEAASNRDKNSSLFAKKSLSPILSSSILSRKLSIVLLRLYGNYGKLKKR